MPNKPIRMNKLRQIIRLYCQGTGTKRINGMLNLGVGWELGTIGLCSWEYQLYFLSGNFDKGIFCPLVSLFPYWLPLQDPEIANKYHVEK